MPTRKTTRTSPKPARATARSAGTPATAIAARTLHALHPLSAAARAAFLAQTTPAQRAALGGRTRSDGVLRDAGAMIADVAKARAKFGRAIRYGDGRLAFLCEATLALGDAIGHARGSLKGAVVASAQQGAALAKAHAVRDDLVHALVQITRGGDDAALVATIEHDATHDDQLANGLESAADLAHAWLGKAARDAGARALVEGAELTSRDVDAARAAAASLVAAGSTHTTEGHARPNDPPEVNAAEGVVLAEMREAMHAFAAAKKRTPGVPLLVPGPSTREALGKHARGGKAAAPPTTAPPTADASPPT